MMPTGPAVWPTSAPYTGRRPGHLYATLAAEQCLRGRDCAARIALFTGRTSARWQPVLAVARPDTIIVRDRAHARRGARPDWDDFAALPGSAGCGAGTVTRGCAITRRIVTLL